MWKTIDRIRRKPKATHSRYAFGGATIITGLIALIWVASISARFDNTPPPSPAAENREAGSLAGLATRFDDAKTLIIQTYQSFGGGSTTDTDVELSAPSAAEEIIINTQETPTSSSRSPNEAETTSPETKVGKPVLIKSTTDNSTTTQSSSNRPG